MGRAETAELDDDLEEDLTGAIAETKDDDGPEDNGNTPDTPEQIAAADEARKKALKQVANPDEEDDAAKGKMIPKGRFDEVNVRMQTAERLLAELIAARAADKAPAPMPPVEPAAPAFDVKAAMKQKLAALASGDDDKALELEEQIAEHQLSVATKRAIEQMTAANAELTAAQQQQEMQRAAAELVKAYPQLDPQSPDVDADAIDFVVARRNKLYAEGVPMHMALRQAVDVAAKRFGLNADTAEDSSPTKTDPAAARIIAARTAAAAALNQQPPDLGGRGNRATEIARRNVATMTDDEFAALPEAEKKRLRGDA